jgi:hypothetical protein
MFFLDGPNLLEHTTSHDFEVPLLVPAYGGPRNFIGEGTYPIPISMDAILQ